MDFYAGMFLVLNLIVFAIYFFISLIVIFISNNRFKTNRPKISIVGGALFLSLFSTMGIILSQYMQYKLDWISSDPIPIVLDTTYSLNSLIVVTLSTFIIFGSKIAVRYRVTLILLLLAIINGVYYSIDLL